MFANDFFALDELEELSTAQVQAAGLVEKNITSTLNDSLLYEGSPITVGESLLLTITFALTHNITGEALVDLLSLIACHCKSPNSCILTLNKFKKHFKDLKSPLVCHYYCSFCFGVRGKNDVQCRECGLSMTKEQAEKSFFIESPVFEQLQTLFSSERYCTANVHYLLHLTESVAWLGPLWATSCFAFENLNGFTKTLFHGTQHVAEQILTSVQIIQGIPTLETKVSIDSPVDVLYKKMTNRQQSSDCRYEFAPGYFAIGAKKIREFGKNIHEDAAISIALQGQKGKCEVFSRCEVNSKVIHSLSYKRVTKRNTYTICFQTADGQCYGQVSYYLVNTPICNSLCSTVCNFHTSTYWALICKLRFSEIHTLDFNQDDGLSFPIVVKSSQICTLKKPLLDNFDFHVLPISDILDLVSCVEFENDDDVLYVSHSPNTIEKD